MNIAIIGASGEIGRAFINEILARYDVNKLYAFSRKGKSFDNSCVTSKPLDIEDEDSIANAVKVVEEKLDLIIIATGFLHNTDIMPEKSIKELSAVKFQKLFAVNTIGPAILAKHFIPYMAKNKKSTLAFLSARVGSISDNYLGGWYAYRASKAALNMIIKNLSIEVRRSNKNAVIVGLHPGTVASDLSEPFQNNVKKEKLFTAEYSANHMLDVIEEVSIDESGFIFAYDKQKIEY